MGCECITTLITLFGFLVALATIWFGFYQFKEEKRFKKLNHFTELRNRFKQNKDFTEIRKQVLKGDSKDVDLIKLYDYVGFFEELQISINSGFVDEEKIYYLFGHYILAFEESDLSKYIDKKASLWSVYNKLITTMKNVKNKDYSNIKF
jgi:hypothetical protein